MSRRLQESQSEKDAMSGHVLKVEAERDALSERLQEMARAVNDMKTIVTGTIQVTAHDIAGRAPEFRADMMEADSD